MFTCPTNEIHSLYLDKELPQNYIAEYEAHIANCEKCKATMTGNLNASIQPGVDARRKAALTVRRRWSA